MVPGLTRAALKTFANRASVIFTLLFASAMVGFFAVSHLVNRFREQEKALGRHLYAQGQAEQASGAHERAIGDFRAALSYDRDNFQYELSLARSLRDSGRTVEANSYLLNLWERGPEDGAVNLALGRLAAREGAVSEAIHYYHNATYGVWQSDAENHRRNAEFELINFLLVHNELLQAQGELITFSASLPPDTELEMQVAGMFARTNDLEHSLSEYQAVLRHDGQNAAALEGSGQAAFKLHRYRMAEKYLADRERVDPQNVALQQSLDDVRSILQADPFSHGITNVERAKRVRAAFERAGEILAACASLNKVNSEGTNQQGSANSDRDEFSPLQESWSAMKPEFGRRGAARSDTSESVMALVFRVERQAENRCGPPTALDQALLELAQSPPGSDQ